MTVAEAMNFMRMRFNDALGQVYTDDDVRHYLNLGIQSVAVDLVRSGNPIMIKTMTVASYLDDTIPADFQSLLPGQPVRLENGKIRIDPGYDGSSVSVKYFKTIPELAYGDSIPLPEPMCHMAVNSAVEVALMVTGHDVSPETQFGLRMRGSGGGD